MATVELFTIGGGEYIVNVLNAVAAWTGSGGYKSLLQVVMVMGLAYSVIVVAFNADWRAWLNWFLQATLMYMVLMVPRMDVQVTDRINPSLAPAQVANVPLGLAMMASFTSQVGDYLVRSSELVFGLPGDLDYSRNGMIYASRLFGATQSLRIRDPEFASNLDEHFRQCVFYDVLLGRYSMQSLADAPDIWAAIAPGSQARAQRFLTRDTGGNVTSSIVTCREGYTALNIQWTAMVDDLGKAFGRQLYPREAADLAKAKLFADLPVAYQYLTGVSSSASSILKQSLAINALTQAMHGMAGASGTSSIDVYAQTRAEIQTRNTYGSIAHAAMKWVPLLNIVLTVVFYALFPVLFPLFLMPAQRTGCAQRLCDGVLLSCGMGTAVCGPAHDPDVQRGRGGRRHWRWQRAHARELCRDERDQRRCGHVGRISGRVDPVPCWWHRQGRACDFEPGDELSQSVAECRRGSRAGGIDREYRGRQCEFRQPDRPDAPARSMEPGTEFCLWCGADAGVRRYRHDVDNIPGQPDPRRSRLETAVHPAGYAVGSLPKPPASPAKLVPAAKRSPTRRSRVRPKLSRGSTSSGMRSATTSRSRTATAMRTAPTSRRASVRSIRRRACCRTDSGFAARLQTRSRLRSS